MAAEDDRLDLQNAAEQGNKDAKDFLAKLEPEEEKTKAKYKLKNKCLRLNGKIYAFLSGKPYPNNPKKFVYVVGKMDKASPDPPLNRLGEKVDYFLWNVEFTDEEGNMDVWPYEEVNRVAVMEELLDDYVEHAFDDD
jgi:hypothetical protein